MRKLKKQNGFTLVEMLIVVAIIAILIAVSIPMVGSALERSRVAVDQANERDAIGLATAEYLAKGEMWLNNGAIRQGDKLVVYYWIDATNHQGAIGGVKPADTLEIQYYWSYGVSKDNEDRGVKITMDLKGQIEKVEWVE